MWFTLFAQQIQYANEIVLRKGRLRIHSDWSIAQQFIRWQWIVWLLEFVSFGYVLIRVVVGGNARTIIDFVGVSLITVSLVGLMSVLLIMNMLPSKVSPTILIQRIRDDGSEDIPLRLSTLPIACLHVGTECGLGWIFVAAHLYFTDESILSLGFIPELWIWLLFPSAVSTFAILGYSLIAMFCAIRAYLKRRS